MTQQLAHQKEQRRALEGLRNGVPNRDAVRVLGCGQTEVTSRFRAQLSTVETAALAGGQVPGTLVAGEFGSGKSHLLQYLKHIALEENFVCSLIVVSKETPLFDPGKIFTAAVESAVVPNITGHAIQELAVRLRQDSPKYVDMFHWAERENGDISPCFPATMLLHERLSNDPEMVEKIRGFWAGEKLAIADLRAGMRQIQQATTYPLRAVPVKDLPLQRFKFAARLMAAAGFRGWVLLIDEAELIGRYSLLQRGRSYAELARWMGRVEADQYPYLTTVVAITSAFAPGVLQEKHDLDYVVPRLQSRNTDEFRALAARAETGMRII
ncbi:MAG: BREX system ATP-binding domain-containing protein, partial [Chloroflexota bacterium]